MNKKFISEKQVLVEVAKARKQGKKIITTNGVFDILHIGHIRNLSKAKKLGDILIVGVNSDASVRINKGPLRPIIPGKERGEVLAALEAVDFVFLFKERTPLTWIEKIKPDIHVKGGGKDILSHPDFPNQKKILDRVGAKFVLVPHMEGRSTSDIISKIKRH